MEKKLASMKTKKKKIHLCKKEKKLNILNDDYLIWLEEKPNF
jgi:hypothetical protein